MKMSHESVERQLSRQSRSPCCVFLEYVYFERRGPHGSRLGNSVEASATSEEEPQQHLRQCVQVEAAFRSLEELHL